MQMGGRSSKQRSGPLKVKARKLVKPIFTKTRATLLSCTNNKGDVEKKKKIKFSLITFDIFRT